MLFKYFFLHPNIPIVNFIVGIFMYIILYFDENNFENFFGNGYNFLLAAVWNSFIEMLYSFFFFSTLLFRFLKIDIFIDIAYLLSTR